MQPDNQIPTPQPVTYEPNPVLAAPQSGQKNPGSTMGLVGLILSFFPFIALPAFIVSLIGFIQSKKARQGNVKAVIGMIISLLWISLVVFGIALQFNSAREGAKCYRTNTSGVKVQTSCANTSL